MDYKKVAKSNQEQAIASWINYLNQIRLDRLMETLKVQDVNLAEALSTLNDTLSIINKSIIERNRGGIKGMHGFIAEVAECGVGNARREILGKLPNYVWINDNGPADLIRDGVQIQQKFVASGNHLSLQAIKQHFSVYPWFIDNGGKYQIPQDHYEKIKYLLSITRQQADKLPTTTGEFSLKQWKEVHDFFENSNIKLQDIEPSKLSYKSVQADNIQKTLHTEKQTLVEIDKELRKEAYKDSQPTFQQGTKVAVTSAIIEGGTSFVMAIAKKKKNNKTLNDFTQEDWRDIFKSSGFGTAKGGIRGISIYALTNYTATPAAVANSLCTATFGIAEQTYLLRTGKITEPQFIQNAELLCLDSAVSALSSFIGHIVIPVPVLGAVIGNTVGVLMCQIVMDTLSDREKQIITRYFNSLQKLEHQLDLQYKSYIEQLNNGLKKYYSLLETAFMPDYRIALDGSVTLAIQLGVPASELLKDISEIDDYFMS